MSWSAAEQAGHHRKLRTQVLLLLGGVCVRCGFTDHRALQIDHCRGGGRKDRAETVNTVAFLRRVRASWNAGERGKYQLLCANCNWIKRAEEREYGGIEER